MNILKLVRNNFYRSLDKEQQEWENRKIDIVNDLTRTWSFEEIKEFNINHFVDSSYRWGGCYLEEDIKMIILNTNRVYFSDDEYKYYFYFINDGRTTRNDKAKIKKINY